MEEINKFLDDIRKGLLILSPNTSYGVKQLEAFIVSGRSLDEIYRVGVPTQYHDELEKFNDLFQQEKAEWNDAVIKIEANIYEGSIDDETSTVDKILCYKNALEFYIKYLDKWNTNELYYNLEHIEKARSEVDRIRSEVKNLKRNLYDELYEDMKSHPYIYKPDMMKKLLNGCDNNTKRILEETRKTWKEEEKLLNGFVICGFTLKIEELKKKSVIPQNFSASNLTDPDCRLSQRKVDDMGEYPAGRTDVFFLGVPRSGKSSVLAGILYAMNIKASAMYIPQKKGEIDQTKDYKDGLKGCVYAHKCPESTPDDTICFLKFNIWKNVSRFFGLVHRKVELPVNFVEMSGESFTNFEAASGNIAAKKKWDGCGARKCLEARNEKVLFIIIDYAVTQGGNYYTNLYAENVRNDINDDAQQNYTGNLSQNVNDTVQNTRTEQGRSDHRTEQGRSDQIRTLENAITIFMTDGDCEDGKEGCTMSRVKSVAFIMSKCDLMEAGKWSERRKLAKDYIMENFRTVVALLDKAHDDFGVNVRDSENNINVLPFSLGKFYVGNTYEYNGGDSEKVIYYLREVLDN